MANEFVHATVGTSLTQIEFEAVGLHVLNSQATGDLIYASSSSQLSRLGIGATNKVLTVIGGVPTWQSTLAGLTLTNPTINACVLGGNMTVTGYAFDAGAVSALINTTSGGQGLTLTSTQDGASGATLTFRVVSASPAAGDVIADIYALGKNSTPASFDYGHLFIKITDPTATSEDSQFAVQLVNAGADNLAMTLSGAGVVSPDHSIMFGQSQDSAAVADQVSLGGYEISAGHRALAISSEEVVVVETDETKFSHKLPVRINGATYNIMLCAT